MTGLDALRQRGWNDARTDWPTGHTTFHVVTADADAEVTHEDPVVAERMAVAAALTAEGHDLLALLRDARTHVYTAYHPEDPVLARIDAVLEAAGEGT